MSDDLPTPIWSGSFFLGDVELKCHTLSDGQRIIEVESVEALFATGFTYDEAMDGMAEFAAWKNGGDIQQ